MWSKTKQTLENRLPEDLKGRVKYQYDVYRDGSSEIQAMSIRVDGEVWFCTNPKMYNIVYPVSWGGPGSLTLEEAIKKSGYVDNSWGEAMKYVHQFLNVLSIDEAIVSDNYFIRLLAMLDARLGKRRIRKIAEHIENEPEWFRKWIGLRLGKSYN